MSTMESATNPIKAYFDQVIHCLDSINADILQDVAKQLLQCISRSNTIFIAGNGGSAATASHFAVDLVKGVSYTTNCDVKAISLSDSSSIITCIGNDLGYDHIFSFPLSKMAKPGDILLALSCSGNSPNIIKALETAKEKQIFTISLTAFDGGNAQKLSDINIHVPIKHYEVSEDVHLSILHCLKVVLIDMIAESRGSATDVPG